MVNTTQRERFSEAHWFDPSIVVTIGGLGSIGSWLCFMMSRLVDKIYVYDFDKVEEVNMAGQIYGSRDLNKIKTEACSDMVSNYSPGTTIIQRSKFEKESPVTPICFAGFDSMQARKDMFESWKKLENRELFVDGRLTAEQLWVYAVVKGKESEYEKYLFSDDEVEDLPCSFKSTTHISSMIASIMTVMFTNYIANKKTEGMAVVPFETAYTAPLNMYDVI